MAPAEHTNSHIVQERHGYSTEVVWTGPWASIPMVSHHKLPELEHEYVLIDYKYMIIHVCMLGRAAAVPVHNHDAHVHMEPCVVRRDQSTKTWW